MSRHQLAAKSISWSASRRPLAVTRETPYASYRSRYVFRRAIDDHLHVIKQLNNNNPSWSRLPRK